MLHTQITCLKSFRIGAFFATSLLALLLILFVFPTASMDDTKAANTLSETTLSMTTANIGFAFDVSDPTGTFSASTPTEFTVTTNNYTGYTLRIRAKEDNEDNSKLLNGEYAFNSISAASSENDFTNGAWGYKPSKINSAANTDFLPAPSYEGDIIDATNAANNEANSYSIALGAKADYSLPAGDYKNTFIITAVANPVGYQITYDKNTEDEVNNMPQNQIGDTASTGITISSMVPSRADYAFMGWHDDDTDTDYQPGDTIDLNQIADANDFHLKAIWRKAAFLDTGSNVNVKLKKLAGYTGSSYSVANNTIKEIQMADSLPNNFVPSTNNTISIATSPNPIYAWFDNTDNKGIIYIYANDADIIANSDTSNMFYNFQSLTNIDGATNWDTSSVTNMSYMFQSASSLININGATNWNTSNVTNMRSMFSGATSLTNIDGATNWNTSKTDRFI